MLGLDIVMLLQNPGDFGVSGEKEEIATSDGVSSGSRPQDLYSTKGLCGDAGPPFGASHCFSEEETSHLNPNSKTNTDQFPLTNYSWLGVEQRYNSSLLSLSDFVLEHEYAISSYDESRRSSNTKNLPCQFQSADCITWARQGKCMVNASAKDYYTMATKCCPACDYLIAALEYFTACPLMADNGPTKTIWNTPGSITETFMKLVHQYKDPNDPVRVVVHGAPDTLDGILPAHLLSPTIQYSTPWIVTLDNFVTYDEADTLIQHGEIMGYRRSKDGVSTADGSYSLEFVDFRTSREVYCRNDCNKDVTVQSLMQRILTALGNIPTLDHCDYLQLLKYDSPGQFYHEHADYHPHQAYGARAITWYMYLSDVTNGGETQFPRLPFPLSIEPRKGRVLVWSNVLDGDPLEEDTMARHAALPLGHKGGIKYGATAWFHHRPIRRVRPECRN